MTLDQLGTAVNSILTDTIHKLAALAPSEVEITIHYLNDRWPDDEEIADMVRNEAAWILEEARKQEERLNDN